MELEDYRAKKHWVVFEVDLNDLTPKRMVSKAAEKVQKLPKGMEYRLLSVRFQHSIALLGPKELLTDCTVSKSFETLPMRAQETSSFEIRTGAARTSVWKINCDFFDSESFENVEQFKPTSG